MLLLTLQAVQRTATGWEAYPGGHQAMMVCNNKRRETTMPTNFLLFASVQCWGQHIQLVFTSPIRKRSSRRLSPVAQHHCGTTASHGRATYPRFGSYHPFVILLVNANCRLLDDNVGDFRKIGKIVPQVSNFVFFFILFVFAVRFFLLLFLCLYRLQIYFG